VCGSLDESQRSIGERFDAALEIVGLAHARQGANAIPISSPRQRLMIKRPIGDEPMRQWPDDAINAQLAKQTNR
jgi:hypothetical protein